MPLFRLPPVPKLEVARSVGKLIKALRHHDVGIRRAASEALGRIGDAQAVEALSVALSDADSGVRRTAAEALGRIGDARAREALTVAMGDAEWLVGKATVKALGRLGDAGTVDALVAALADTDSIVRRTAAKALDGNGWKPGRDATGVVYWVAQREWSHCAEIGSPAVGPLIAALSDRDPDVRRGAAGALGRLGDRGAVDAVAGALVDRDAGVRQTAAEALGLLGDARAVDGLEVAMHDSEAKVRWAAAEALGHVGDARAAPALTEVVLRCPSEKLRLEAARALGRIGDEASVARLVDELTATHDQSNSVAYVGPEGEEYPSRPRRDGADVLGALAHVRATECLVRWLADSDPEAREAAALALGAISGTRGVDALVHRATSDDCCTFMGDPIGHPGHYRVRCAAVLALHRIGTPEALATISSAWPGAEVAAHEYLDKRHQQDDLTCLGYAMTSS